MRERGAGSRPPRVAFLLLLILGTVSLVLHTSCARSVTSDFDPNGPSILGADAGDGALQNMCISTVCPSPFATCVDVPGYCTVNLNNDIDHCGSCNTQCLRHAPNGSFVCSDGQCRLACQPQTADCNHSITDGCETATDMDPANCGGCGLSCDGGLCWKGACGCPSGFTQCGQDCKQTQTDSMNCGSCGNVCHAPANPNDPAWICGPDVQPLNTKWLCQTGACALQCAPSWGDCDKNFCGNGCETGLLVDPNNCGACGNKCAAGQTCSDGVCLCPEGTINCSGACVDIQTDPFNCGGCGDYCPGPASVSALQNTGGSPACKGGQCSYVCFPHYADCNHDVDDGCEVNIETDPLHCGSCGTPCPLGPNQPCVLGKCLTRECDGGVIN